MNFSNSKKNHRCRKMNAKCFFIIHSSFTKKVYVLYNIVFIFPSYPSGIQWFPKAFCIKTNKRKHIAKILGSNIFEERKKKRKKLPGNHYSNQDSDRKSLRANPNENLTCVTRKKKETCKAFQSDPSKQLQSDPSKQLQNRRTWRMYMQVSI